MGVDQYILKSNYTAKISTESQLKGKRRVCTACQLLCSSPHRVRALIKSVDGRRLSVCLSVCPVPDAKSRTEERSKLNIGRKEAYDTGDP